MGMNDSEWYWTWTVARRHLPSDTLSYYANSRWQIPPSFITPIQCLVNTYKMQFNAMQSKAEKIFSDVIQVTWALRNDNPYEVGPSDTVLYSHRKVISHKNNLATVIVLCHSLLQTILTDLLVAYYSLLWLSVVFPRDNEIAAWRKKSWNLTTYERAQATLHMHTGRTYINDENLYV